MKLPAIMAVALVGILSMATFGDVSLTEKACLCHIFKGCQFNTVRAAIASVTSWLPKYFTDVLEPLMHIKTFF